MTPNEIGLQEIKRLIKVSPQMGTIKPFEKKEFSVDFKKSISEQEKIIINNYAISKDKFEKDSDVNFKYTCKILIV